MSYDEVLEARVLEQGQAVSLALKARCTETNSEFAQRRDDEDALGPDGRSSQGRRVEEAAKTEEDDKGEKK
jgi:hypothetical protein